MRRAGRRWIGGAFTAVTLAWLLVIVLTPALLARGAHGHAVTLMSAGAYVMGGVVCHQRPDRSFHPGGVQMPVCARCFGLYLGGGLGVLAAAGFRRRGAGAAEPGGGPRPAPAEAAGGVDGGAGAAEPRGRREGGPAAVRTGPAAFLGAETGVGAGRGPADRAPAWLRWAVLAAAAPTGITFAAEMAGWMPSIGELRAAAGVPLGVAVTWVASLVIRGDLA